jgi:hypothetical protein
MFAIFTRLTAGEGDPPDEDRISPSRPAGRHRTASSAQASLQVMLFPAVLLVILAVVFTVILSAGHSSCAPQDRASVFAYQTAKVSACERAQTTKTIATISR